jgi:hypothetical protein
MPHPATTCAAARVARPFASSGRGAGAGRTGGRSRGGGAPPNEAAGRARHTCHSFSNSGAARAPPNAAQGAPADKSEPNTQHRRAHARTHARTHANTDPQQTLWARAPACCAWSSRLAAAVRPASAQHHPQFAGVILHVPSRGLGGGMGGECGEAGGVWWGVAHRRRGGASAPARSSCTRARGGKGPGRAPPRVCHSTADHRARRAHRTRGSFQTMLLPCTGAGLLVASTFRAPPRSWTVRGGGRRRGGAEGANGWGLGDPPLPKRVVRPTAAANAGEKSLRGGAGTLAAGVPLLQPPGDGVNPC